MPAVSQVRILIFAKAPAPGRVKTRLIPALGAEGAARLAGRLLSHALKQALAADLGPVEICAGTPGLAALAPGPSRTGAPGVQRCLE